MNTVTLPKTEYQKLKFQASAYRRFAEKFFEYAMKDPVDQVVSDFRATNIYTDDFLNDLEDGLKKSSYGKRYANQASQK